MKTPDLQLPEGILSFFSETAEETARQLAEDVAEALRTRLARVHRATLVVSGGSTPLPFFHSLSSLPLDWARVNILLADERWVPEGDPASNTTLVRDHLMQGAASAARFIPLKQPFCSPEQALPAMELLLAEVKLPLDVVVLGMGDDGHTASLFPDAPELQQAMAPGGSGRIALMTPPSQAHTRVTLRLPVLAGARFTALHLKGQDKLQTLAQAAERPDEWQAMPIRAFLKPGLRLYWSP